MKKENVFKNCKKLTASFVAALLLVCSSGVSADVFAKAEDAPVVYGTGCIPDSKAVLEKNQATDAEIYDLDYINESNTVTYNSLVNVCKAANLSALPETVDISNQFPAPGNQGVEGSCTAWAVAYGLKSHQEYLEHGWDLSNPKAQYSPAYVYNQINGGKDEGSSVSVAMELITNQGVCSLYNMKYSQYDYLTQPNESQKDMASNFKASSWRSIYGVEAVKEQLADNQGVAIVVACYPDFDDIGPNNETYDVINSGDIDRAYHAICLVGYDDANQRFKFMNSWGPKWGLNGYGYISYDMFNDDRNDSGWAYVLEDEKHSDSEKFFTSVPSTGCVKATSDVRLYTSPDYYRSSDDKDYYYHTVNPGTKIKIDSFVSSSNGMQPYFKTSDGYYINAQKTQLEVADSNDLINNILINGNENNSVSSISNSETSRISFTSNSNVKYNNHNTLKIDYTVNQSDSYNGYAGAKISGDTTVSTNGATGIGFWYMTPAGQNGTVALCMQGSVSKKIAQIPTTNGEWKYYYNTYNFNGSNMSDIEIYINGSENNCVTSPATGTIYIAELAATNGVADDDTTNYYSFSVTAGKGGTVSGKSNGTYAEGTSISVTATADSNYKFKGWSNTEGGSIISTDSTYTFNISKDTTLYANFEDITTYYTFSITAGEGGSVSGTASGTYAENVLINVTASAKFGYKFIGWSKTQGGSIISTNAAYSFNLNENTTLYANFEKLNLTMYTINVVEGEGCSSIVYFNSDSNGNHFVSGEYAEGYTMTLVANALSGYKFVGWWTNSSFSGDPVSTSYSYGVKVEKNLTLYPKFAKKDATQYSFTVTASEGGTLGGSKSGAYDKDSYIFVAAYANEGYEFKGWSYTKGGAIFKTDYTHSFNISNDTTLYANFEKIPDYTLTVVKTQGFGSISLDGSDVTSKSFRRGTTVDLFVNAASGYKFVGWWTNSSFSGDPVGTSSHYTICMENDVTLYPKFEKLGVTSYNFNVSSSTGGSVGGSTSGTYKSGTYIFVVANAESGYEFKGWSYTKGGSIFRTDYTYGFNISEDTTLYANFEKIPDYTLTVVKTEGLGSLSLDGSDVTSKTFQRGTTVDIFAYGAKGYKIVGWWTNSSFSGDPIGTSNHITVRMDNNITLYPKFESTVTDTDSDIFIKGISNNIGDWTNANSGSSLTITTGSSDYLYNNAKTMKISYTINTNDQYGGYAGRTVSLESTYNNRGTSNYDGVGFWYLTPSGFNGQIALCLQSGSAGLDDLVQLPATNGEWKYYFYETGKTNISDMTLYINGSKNGYTTTSSNGVASGTLYIANMKVTKK